MQNQGLEIWSFALFNAFNEIASKVGTFLPNLVAAFVVFLLGVLIANFSAKIITNALKTAQVDTLFKNLGVKGIFERSGFDLSVAAVTGWVVKWFVIVVFLIAVTSTLGLPQVATFINSVALYIPNVIGAAVILVIGLVVANVLSETVYKTTSASKLGSPGLISSVVKWSILGFVFLAVLVQLRIAERLIETLFTGIVAALALALGVSFGMGGKDAAARVIDHLASQLERKSKK